MSKLPIQSLVLVTLLSSSLLAQRYQAHDHTVFHPPAPPAKHASTQTGAGTSNSRTSNDASRHHDVTYSSSASSHTAQPVQIPSRVK